MTNVDLYVGVIQFIVLLLSLSIHESAHAWTADTLGDPTARYLGRVSLNPLVHADPIGTILFPLIGMFSGLMFGWAKPVPVNVARLRNPASDLWNVSPVGSVVHRSPRKALHARHFVRALVPGRLKYEEAANPEWDSTLRQSSHRKLLRDDAACDRTSGQGRGVLFHRELPLDDIPVRRRAAPAEHFGCRAGFHRVRAG